jgi:hypothetical protein
MRKILIALTLLIASSAFALGWDDINWSNCGPSGIQRRIKLATDEKGFWASQHTTLEYILQVNSSEVSGWKQDCYYQNGSSPTKQAACILQIDVKMQNIYRCLSHSALMCRNFGGYC